MQEVPFHNRHPATQITERELHQPGIRLGHREGGGEGGGSGD